MAKALELPAFTHICVSADQWAFNFRECIEERLVRVLAEEVYASKQVEMTRFFEDLMAGQVEVLGFYGDGTIWDPFEPFQYPQP